MKKFVHLLTGLLLTILFFSCDNFLKASNTKNEIEKSIAYANASSYTISFDFPKSCGVIKTPAESEIRKKVSDVFPIRFDPFTEYEFVEWKIIDSVLPNCKYENGTYLKIEKIDEAETTVSFVNAPNPGNHLCLYPVVTERPQIISNSPIGSSALKDSSITVIFDHDMDPASIYFTEEEIAELMAEYGISKDDFLPPIDSAENHYGYKKGDEIFFKNISLKNNKTEENINAYFSEPEFENPRTLTIHVSETNTLTDFTQVLVSIDKGFFYSKQIEGQQNKKRIELSGSKRWMYQVNNRSDTQPLLIPKYEDEDLITIKTVDDVEILKTSTCISIQQDGSDIGNLVFVKDNQLYLDILVQEQENGSGPMPYFELYATRLYDENYMDLRQYSTDGNLQLIYPKYYENPYKIYYQTVTADAAVFKGTVDLTPMNLEPGVYQLYFVLYDKRNNKQDYPYVPYGSDGSFRYYYFAIDNEVGMPEPIITDESSSGVKLKVSWEPKKDYYYTRIRYKKHDEDETSWSEEVIYRSENYKEYEDLEFSTEYDFELSFYDYAGHEQKYICSKSTTDWGLTVTGTPEKRLYFKGESFDKSGITVNLIDLVNNTSRVLTEDEWDTDFDSSDVSKEKWIYVLYENNGLIKKCMIPSVYYIAEANAITEEPVNIGTSFERFKFGDFPQTIAEHQEDSYYSTTNVFHSWYIGKDGYFYEKCQEQGYRDYFYSDGTKTTQKETNTYQNYKYFKVEPLTWMVLSSDGNEYKLLSEKVLTANIPFYVNNQIRTIYENPIYPNNYKYSTIRAYLNGSYESGDTQLHSYYTGFLQMAFTNKAKTYIVTQENAIDNSDLSTYTIDEIDTSGNNNEDYSNKYSCPDTFDKITLLSALEASILNSSDLLAIEPTDYAIANYYETTLITNWWTRSPSRIEYNNGTTYSARTVNNYNYFDVEVTNQTVGIVPYFTISLSSE